MFDFSFYKEGTGALTATLNRNKIIVEKRVAVAATDFAPSLDGIHIIVGGACLGLQTLAPSTDGAGVTYTAGAANVTTESSYRGYALVYGIEGETLLQCTEG